MPRLDATSGREWTFVLEMEAGTNLLLRALARFPAEGASVKRLNLQTQGCISRLEVQAADLATAGADRLRARFAGMGGIQHVTCGHRPDPPRSLGEPDAPRRCRTRQIERQARAPSQDD